MEPSVVNPPDDNLFDGGVIWRPSGKVFLKRAFLASLITAFLLSGGALFLVLLAFDLRGAVIALGLLGLSALFYMFIFDEWQNWNRHRGDEWRLTDTAIGFRNTDDSLAFSDLPLTDVKSIKRAFWRGIRIRMTNGRAFHISYLPEAPAVLAALQEQHTKVTQ